jgi:hypothetical protein
MTFTVMNKATERPGQLEAFRQRQIEREIEKEKLDPRSKVTVFTVLVERSNGGQHRTYIPFYTDNWEHAHFYASRTGQEVGFVSLYHAEESHWRYLWEHCLDSVKGNSVVTPNPWRMW